MGAAHRAVASGHAESVMRLVGTVAAEAVREFGDVVVCGTAFDGRDVVEVKVKRSGRDVYASAMFVVPPDGVWTAGSLTVEQYMDHVSREIEAAAELISGKVAKRFRVQLQPVHSGQYMVNQKAVRALAVGSTVSVAGRSRTVVAIRHSGPGFIKVNESRWANYRNRVKARLGAKLWLEFEGLVPESTQ